MLTVVLLGAVSLKKQTNQELADLYFDIDFATNYLFVSSATYCHFQDVPTLECPPCKNLTSYKFFNMTVSTTIEGQPQKVVYLIDTRNEQLVVGFEGTHNPEQILVQGINLHGMHYDLQDDLPEAIVDAYYLKSYNNGVFRESVEHNLKAMTYKYPRYQVVFTGHSLGGALTVVAAYDAIKEGWIEQTEGKRPSPMIYTFGQPRLGNMIYQKALNDQFNGYYYRVTHHRDMIPHVPPCVLSLFNPNTLCEAGIGIDLMWYPLHAGIEVFFDDDTATNYRVCENVEDATCSMKYIGTSIADHRFYLGLWDNCPGDDDK